MLQFFSRFYDVSYEARGLVVLAALGAIAIWDVLRHGRGATRWREYAFWLACGDVQGLAPELRQILSEHDVRRFLTVHRVHAGLYIGGVMATVASAVWIRIARRTLMVDHATDTRDTARPSTCDSA